MKKILLYLIFISQVAFAQSVEIKPNDEKIMVSSLSETPIVIGRRGSLVGGLPSNTSINSSLLFLGARGFVDGEYRVNSAASIALRANQTFTSTANGTHILFQTTADNTTSVLERMRIAHNGNVGIGTTNPLTKLHISSGTSGASPEIGTNVIIENSSHNILNLLTPDSRETGILFTRTTSGNTGGINYSSANKLNFVAGGSTQMTVLPDGKVGIGTSSPETKLDIRRSSSGITTFRPNGILNLESSGDTDVEMLTNTGRIGIWFRNPSAFPQGVGIAYNKSGEDEITIYNGNYNLMEFRKDDKIYLNSPIRGGANGVAFSFDNTGVYASNNPSLNIAPVAVGEFCKEFDETNISSATTNNVPVTACNFGTVDLRIGNIITSTNMSVTHTTPFVGINQVEIVLRLNLDATLESQFTRLLAVVGDIHIAGTTPNYVDKIYLNDKIEFRIMYFRPTIPTIRKFQISFIVYGIKN